MESPITLSLALIFANGYKKEDIRVLPPTCCKLPGTWNYSTFFGRSTANPPSKYASPSSDSSSLAWRCQTGGFSFLFFPSLSFPHSILKSTYFWISHFLKFSRETNVQVKRKPALWGCFEFQTPMACFSPTCSFPACPEKADLKSFRFYSHLSFDRPQHSQNVDEHQIWMHHCSCSSFQCLKFKFPFSLCFSELALVFLHMLHNGLKTLDKNQSRGRVQSHKYCKHPKTNLLTNVFVRKVASCRDAVGSFIVS